LREPTKESQRVPDAVPNAKPERRVLIARNLVGIIADAGADVQALAREAGIEPERLEAELTWEEWDRFLSLVWGTVDDSAFGLRAGTILRPERFGAIGFLLMTSADLGTMLSRIARYNRLVGGGAHPIERRGETSVVRLLKSPTDRPYSCAKVDLELSAISTFARVFTAGVVSPLWAARKGPPPPHAAHYEPILGCPVTFDAEDDSIAFKTRDLAVKLVTANLILTNAVERILEKRLENLSDDSIAAQVRDAIRPMLNGEEPTLAAVARKLALSTRTLQRRLSDEGVRFSQLLDDVRHGAAKDLLTVPGATVLEVSYLLGFAEASSFFRAFKRWTGTTPEAYRAALTRVE
jgi:AraC-like DNA-binding protein